MAFWNALNDYLVNAFTAAMGPASSYPTMKAQTINDRIYADAHEWATWQLPAVSVACYRIRYSADEHMGSGNGKKLYKKQYQCAVFGVISGNINYVAAPVIDTISDNIREYYERVEDVLTTGSIVLSSGGVIGRDVTIITGDLDIARYPNDDIDSKRRFGIAYLEFVVTARK